MTTASRGLSVFRCGATTYLRQYAVPLIPIVSIAQPFVFTIIVISIDHSVRSGPPVDIGPASLAVWTVTLGASAWGLWLERLNGRLALLVSAPASTIVYFAGFLAGAVSFAFTGLVTSLVVAPLAAGQTVNHLATPWLPVGLAALYLSMYVSALLLLPLFALSQFAPLWFDALVYPIPILAGFFVSVSALPSFLRPLSHGLIQYWGVLILRDSFARSPDLAEPIGWLMGLMIAYACVGFLVSGWSRRRFRVEGLAINP
jgi:hypothetical protein